MKLWFRRASETPRFWLVENLFFGWSESVPGGWFPLRARYLFI